MSKVIIAGSRGFNNYTMLCHAMEYIVAEDGANIEVTEVVCGEAVGADTLGRKWAEERDITVASFPANWDSSDGKKAGIMRNLEMAHYGDVLVAFWDGESGGTANMIEISKKKGLRVFVKYYYKNGYKEKSFRAQDSMMQ